MAFQGISTGSGPNVGDGDTLIAGALKINSNFFEIYNALGDGTTISPNIEPDNIATGIITASQLNVNGSINVTGVSTALAFISTATTGTAPFTVSSTTKVNNLNADLLDGLSSGSFLRSDTSDTMTGNLTVDNGTSTTLTVLCDNGGNAAVRAYGASQGTGYVEVGQSPTYGGGMSYNGDGSPALVGGESADHITFYRMDNGTRTEVFHYPYNSNVVNFNSTPTVSGTNVLLTNASFGGDVSGTYNNIAVANDSHTHDTRYYTESESDTRYLRTDQNTGTTGTLSATGGFNIGISDANGSVTNGPITRLSFLGDGNTITVDGNGVVSITIAGVGGGASGSVGVVNSVNVAEAVTSGNRFGGKDFTVDVTMTEEGTPTTQKGIKGILTGSFPVYQEGTISSMSVTTLNFSSSGGTGIWQEVNYSETELYEQDFIDRSFYGRESAMIVRPTAGGAGNGPGYYIVTKGWTKDIFQNGLRNFRVHFVTDLGNSAGVLYNSFTEVSDSTLLDSTYWRYRGEIPLRIHTEGEYTFIEHQIRPSEIMVGNYAGGNAWHDASGSFYRTNTTSKLYKYSVTSDGSGIYEQYSSNNQMRINFIYRNSNGVWAGLPNYDWNSSNDFEGSAVIGYDRPSNRLVSVREQGGSVFVNAWDIDKSNFSTLSGARLNAVSPSTTLSTGVTAGDLQQMVSCGDAGLYLKLDGDFYRYNSQFNTFSLITNPIVNEFADNDSVSQMPTAGIGGDGSETIWCSDRHTGGANRAHRSTDRGFSWTTSENNSFPDTDYNVLPPGAGFGRVFVNGGSHTAEYEGDSNSLLGSTTNGTRLKYINYIIQDATVSNSANFSVGQRIALKGDETNSEYRGYVRQKTGSTLRIESNTPYNNGDTILNLSNFTSSQTNRYLNLTIGGAVTSIEQGDPGFVNLGSGLSFNISFPGDLGGSLTDTVIPVGTSLKVQVNCNNTAGDSNIVEDTVTPT